MVTVTNYNTNQVSIIELNFKNIPKSLDPKQIYFRSLSAQFLQSNKMYSTVFKT